MAAKKKIVSKQEIAVIVTTTHRGVFFGYAREADVDGESIRLRGGRNCLYWTRETKGFMGLAATGPMPGSRVGPAADIVVRNVTAVVMCTPNAAKVWETMPWTA